MQLGLTFTEPAVEGQFRRARLVAGATLVACTEAVRFASWCTVSARLLQGPERQAAGLGALLGALSSALIAAAYAATKNQQR